jgi:hypothetical protein
MCGSGPNLDVAKKIVVQQRDDGHELNLQNIRVSHDLAWGVVGICEGPDLTPVETDVRTNAESPTDV